MNYWQVGSGVGDRDYSQEFLDDYLQDATRPDLEFHADYEDREIVFWALEAHVKRFGGRWGAAAAKYASNRTAQVPQNHPGGKDPI